MRVEILSEDRSGGVVLQRLTNCILKQYTQDFESYLRPHRGCGYWPDHPDEKPEPLSAGLLELLPAKLRAYDKVYAGTDIVVELDPGGQKRDPSGISGSRSQKTF